MDVAGAFPGWPPNSPPPAVPPNPADPVAVDIYFGLPDGTPQPPPKEQSDLQLGLEKVLRTIQILYRSSDADANAAEKAKFRVYYIRIYRLAQLGLEGAQVATEVASAALTTLMADLINEEASRVKNSHLRALGTRALQLAFPFAVAYVILRCTAPAEQRANVIGIDLIVLSNFMLLWIGCFLGVWLSYGIRTTTFTLNDLTITDADRLVPVTRLVFAGLLTMILGIVFVIPLVEIKIAELPVTAIGTKPMLAFLVGCFCGISELLLPAAVAKRASDFMTSVK